MSQAGQSQMVGEFIMLLRLACELKRMTCSFLECLLNVFRTCLTKGNWNWRWVLGNSTCLALFCGVRFLEKELTHLPFSYFAFSPCYWIKYSYHNYSHSISYYFAMFVDICCQNNPNYVTNKGTYFSYFNKIYKNLDHGKSRTNSLKKIIIK